MSMKTRMKMLSAALLLSVSSLVAPNVSAQGTSVISLTELHESSQLAQFQEKDGDCRFYGAIDHATGDVQIEVKTCLDEGGSTLESPYDATVELESLPVPAGTRLYIE